MLRSLGKDATVVLRDRVPPAYLVLPGSDLVVVQEEMGRLPMPGPYLSSAVAATLTALALGEGDLATVLASGERKGTLALEEPGSGDPLHRISSTAARSNSAIRHGWRIRSTTC